MTKLPTWSSQFHRYGLWRTATNMTVCIFKTLLNYYKIYIGITSLTLKVIDGVAKWGVSLNQLNDVGVGIPQYAINGRINSFLIL